MLPAFTQMQQLLASNMDNMVYHNNTSKELYVVEAKEIAKPKKDTPVQETSDPLAKKTRAASPNTWHNDVKATLEKPIQIAGHPTFSKVMKYCGAQTQQLRIFPKGSKVCGPNAFFGKWQDGEACERSHCLPTQNEVKKILKTVKKFIDEPHAFNDSKLH